MRLPSDEELKLVRRIGARIKAAILAEREACAAECLRLGEHAQTVREKAVALACFAAIHRRSIDGAVSNNDTPAHETPEPN